MSKGLEKYLRDAEQRCTLEPNYFDDSTSCMSEELILEDAEQTTQPPKGNPSIPKQKLTKDTDVTRQTPAILQDSTQKYLQMQTKRKCQQITTSEDVEQHTDAQGHDEKHPDEDTTREPTTMHLE